MKSFLTSEEHLNFKRIEKILELRKESSALILLGSNTLELSKEIEKYFLEKENIIKYIPESDLKLIINSMPRITQGGSYYINDKEFVQKNRLTGLYKNILDPTVMKNILDKNHEEFIAIYESAPLGQKTIINSMVFDKRLNGENVDANILMYLQNKTNIDYINIEPLLKEG